MTDLTESMHMCSTQLTSALFKACFDFWSSDRIYIAFNGGKDATVVLELYSEALKSFCGSSKPQGVWFRENEFCEVETFVDEVTALKQLQLKIYNGSYKTMLREFLRDVQSTTMDTVLIVVGYREADEVDKSRRKFFKMFMPISPDLCYRGFPGVRVNPILTWTYGEVWDFIIQNKVKVCPLYYRGYSSLGSKDQTTINPALKHGQVHPMNLAPWTLERASRTPVKGKCEDAHEDRNL